VYESGAGEYRNSHPNRRTRPAFHDEGKKG